MAPGFAMLIPGYAPRDAHAAYDVANCLQLSFDGRIVS
jgi:hypothetical protein